jgi:hypothetical protein
MKILGKPIPDFLSICKVLGTAMMLLLSNPSEGVDLPGNSIVFSNVISSSPAVDPIDQFACVGGNVTFSVSGGTNYQWEVSTNGGVSWTTTGTNSLDLDLTGVTYSMNNNQYYCLIDGNPSLPATLTVYLLPTPTITGNASVCAGTTGVTYSTAALMTGYTWLVPTGGTITAGTGTCHI